MPNDKLYTANHDDPVIDKPVKNKSKERVGGLSTREYFAAQILQGFFASGRTAFNQGGLAEIAVSQADALIKELNK